MPATPDSENGTEPAITRLLVDGMNVLGSRPDGWWRDRPAAMVRLIGRLGALRERDGVRIDVVFDGNEHVSVAEAGVASGVGVFFAPGGPHAADREIVRILHADPEPTATLVYSSDRRLAAAVKATGSRCEGTSALLAKLPPAPAEAT